MAPNAANVTALAGKRDRRRRRDRSSLPARRNNSCAASTCLWRLHIAEYIPPRARSSSMRAALGDDALVEHQDLVGVDHGRKTVRDHDRRASARDALQRRLNLPFGETVERRRRFVEDQNRRRLQHRARDGDPLLLAARKLEAPLSDRRLIAKRQRADERDRSARSRLPRRRRLRLRRLARSGCCRGPYR